MTKKFLAAIAGVASLALALTACAGGSAQPGSADADGLTPLSFQLNSPGGGYNSGYALALQRGYYSDEGLDVTIEPGNGSTVTAQLVASGQVDMAFADASAAMKLIAEGAEMKIVGTILQGNPNEVTSLADAPIESVKELKGKRVALPNGFARCESARCCSASAASVGLRDDQ